MMESFVLPPVTVTRERPVNLVAEDEALFRHELSRSWGETRSVSGTWDSHPQGFLFEIGTNRVESRWFQGGLPRGKSRLALSAKAWLSRVSYRRVDGPTQPLVITDEFSNGYFHWLADGLPKLALLGDQLEGRTLILPTFASRLRYMTESLAPWPALRTVTLPDRTMTRLNDAILVPSLAPTGNYRPESIRSLARRWRDFVGPKEPCRRVYISRARAPWRKIANEAQILPLLVNSGFEVVQLEGLGFAEQVRLLSETKILIGNHGAGLTNMLFMAPGGQVIEIRRTGDAENNCYFALASAAQLSYRYLLAPAVDQSKNAHVGDVWVEPARLAALLGALT